MMNIEMPISALLSRLGHQGNYPHSRHKIDTIFRAGELTANHLIG